MLRAAGEQVSRQRLRPCPQERQQRVEVAVGQHGQHRAEDFLLHHCVIPAYAGKHGGLHLQGLFAGVSSDLHLTVGKVAAQAVKMLAVHNAGQLGVFQGLCAPEAAHLLLQRFHQLLLHAVRGKGCNPEPRRSDRR